MTTDKVRRHGWASWSLLVEFLLIKNDALSFGMCIRGWSSYLIPIVANISVRIAKFSTADFDCDELVMRYGLEQVRYIGKN